MRNLLFDFKHGADFTPIPPVRDIVKTFSSDPSTRNRSTANEIHPAEEQGTLVFGVGASGIFTNVAAQHVWIQNDYTSIVPPQFFATQFLNTSPRTNLTLCVQPQGRQSYRDAITRRTARGANWPKMTS